ncbi:PPE family protein [Candidatus Mycobacterium wuenschmannii]|uniref:PPE family protein n=1 Tax=Candidatus Mycobacterium wuenschmannii TaxID=3027808 RepID=A0ABY8VW07_9MYCO|nr:PPE family protein [Candidatus Mycobacterium wuenschmannii]WIM87778.1 PPE family protein [Candidatus Mycobacterium wuenschmannii]
MEFTTLPPEVISALIHSGPGSESLVDAAAAWRQLAADLEDAADSYAAAVSSMADTWHGPSSAAMNQSVAPYLTWLRTTSQQAQQVAASAQAAATAFNAASASVVPTATVFANRTQLAQLLATNTFGRNMPAIAANEAAYQQMWANNSAAMTRYQAATAQATNLPQFTSPNSTTNPSAQADQAAAQNAATANSAGSNAAQTAAQSAASSALPAAPIAVDPNQGYIGLANTYANQFVSSGFPINLLSYLAQSQSAQALSGVSAQVGQGVSEGEEALGGGLGGAAAGLGALGAGGGGLGALGAAGLSAPAAAAATGVAVPMGGLMAPPAAGTLLATSQAPVQLASAATPLGAGEVAASGPMLPPLMAPPISAGSGWRKRKSQKYEDISIGAELKGNVMKPPPSAG